ncbi:hypothetical protein [Deinococcus roseus]|uniref:Uncharacterized protein n=1 Tax=Deinococcus roseus TaxID=392414 RepID=A0ABQ2D1G6_9DEIO|nr:hypothetical protein [Deinococcus roseus]GGJ41599.1 hypothetical protein GCM10008938_29530 [Deinococcus roseus]
MAKFTEAYDSDGTVVLLNLDNVQSLLVQTTHDDFFYVEASMVQGPALKLASFDTHKEALAWARKLCGLKAAPQTED